MEIWMMMKDYTEWLLLSVGIYSNLYNAMEFF